MDTQNQETMIRTALRSEDPRGIDLVWESFGNQLLAYLCNLIGSRHDAEDVLQEVFIKIAKNRITIAKADHLQSYLYRMSHNEAMSWIKKRNKSRHEELQETHWLSAEEANPIPMNQIHEAEAALLKLPEEQRTIILMKTAQKISFREISQVMKISENTTASRYRYGIEKLREIMKKRTYEIV